MTLLKAACYSLNNAVLCGTVLTLIGIAFQSTFRFSKRKTIGIMAIGYCIGMVVDLLILETEAPFHSYFAAGTVFIASVDLIFAIAIFKKTRCKFFLVSL